MTDVEILNKLLNDVKELTFEKKDNLNAVRGRASMIIRKLFGEKSPYLNKLNKIAFWPILYFGDYDDNGDSFRSGVRQFFDLVELLIEDLQMNELREMKNEIISFEKTLPVLKKIKEINVFIASPSDANVERQIILDKLETQFRRQKFEEISGGRIIVNGWEELPSQVGLPQDIINQELVQSSHIIIAIIKHKLGTPIYDRISNEKRSISGTVEELMFAIKRQQVNELPIGMIYFYKDRPTTDKIENPQVENEYSEVEKFKEYIQDEMIFKYYSNVDELLQLICKDLSDNIRNKINKI
jgi:hypothetical protein